MCWLQVFFTPLSQALRLIVHLGEPLPEERLLSFGFSFAPVLLFFLSSYGFMILTNGAGASTGMFVPALAVGAAGEGPFSCACAISFSCSGGACAACV